MSNDRSAAVADSWLDPEVAAKRSAHHGLMVDGQIYSSAYQALKALGIDTKSHIKWRTTFKDLVQRRTGVLVRGYPMPDGSHRDLMLTEPGASTAVANQVLKFSDIDELNLIPDTKLVEQVDTIQSDSELTGGEKEVLSKQRIGHSRFAKLVKERAGYRCMVKPGITRNLVAAHIKPWAVCSPEEKTDLGNGLCLSPDMDGLFESGDISFLDDGTVLIGDLSDQEKSSYGLSGKEKISVSNCHAPYLAWHRKFKYKSD